MGASHSNQKVFRLPLLDSGQPSGPLPPPRPLKPQSPMGWLLVPLIVSGLVALGIYMQTHGGLPDLPAGFRPRPAAVANRPSAGTNNYPSAHVVTQRPGAPRSGNAPTVVASRPSPKTDSYPPARPATPQPGPSPSASYQVGSQPAGQRVHVTGMPATHGSASPKASSLSTQQPSYTRVPFKLDKNMGRQQVGPTTVELVSVDGKNQRYTVWLFVQDETIKMIDRALREEVKVDLPGTVTPLELVVTEISQNQVAGYLVLSNGKERRY